MEQLIDYNSIVRQCIQEKQILSISGVFPGDGYEWVLGGRIRELIQAYHRIVYKRDLLYSPDTRLLGIEVSYKFHEQPFGIELSRKPESIVLEALKKGPLSIRQTIELLSQHKVPLAQSVSKGVSWSLAERGIAFFNDQWLLELKRETRV